MFKKILTITVLTLLPFTLSAQEVADEYELRANEKMGWIIDKDGKKIEGVVKLMGAEDTPWENQQKVKFIAHDEINRDKKKQKLKILKTDDLKGYAAYDEGNLREFELINYKNIRESSATDGSGISGKIKLIKNLSTSAYMAEVLVQGSIKVYRLYGLPSSVAIGQSEVREREQDIKKIIESPALLVVKNGGKIEELNSSDFKKLTEDCTYVRTKMLNNEYASYNPEKEEKKKSKFGALLKNEMELNGMKIQRMALEILPEYNEHCGK